MLSQPSFPRSKLRTLDSPGASVSSGSPSTGIGEPPLGKTELCLPLSPGAQNKCSRDGPNNWKMITGLKLISASDQLWIFSVRLAEVGCSATPGSKAIEHRIQETGEPQSSSLVTGPVEC